TVACTTKSFSPPPPAINRAHASRRAVPIEWSGRTEQPAADQMSCRSFLEQFLLHNFFPARPIVPFVGPIRAGKRLPGLRQDGVIIVDFLRQQFPLVPFGEGFEITK